MIYDCFIFFNELELLELRLETLKDIIDRFVIVESAMTHTGKDKKYYYDPERFKDYPITYIQVPKLTAKLPMANEAIQRNHILNGIFSAGADDYIMLSDVDEIPDPESIQKGLGLDRFKIRQKLFYYYVNCLQNQLWDGPVLTRKKHFISGQNCRNDRNENISVFEGGWHYSFLGGADAIKLKLNSFSEQGVNTGEVNNEENIYRCLETGEDIFHRKDEWAKKRFISLDEIRHPQLKEWIKRYPHHYREYA